MSISYKEVTELLSGLQEIEIPNNLSKTDLSDLEKEQNSDQKSAETSASDNVMNVSAFSLDRCDSQELIHCYKLAIEFGVPTARRALAMYQSDKNQTNKTDNSD